MATLKQLRTRLKSMNSTRKITSAMKLVAASKWRRQYEKWKSLKAYVDAFDTEIVLPLADVVESPRTVGRILVVCSPHKGLCGGYPSSIKQVVKRSVAETPFDRIFVTTEKGRSLLSDVLDGRGCEYMDPAMMMDSLSQLCEEGYAISVVKGVSRNALSQEAECVPLYPYHFGQSKHIGHDTTYDEPDMQAFTASVMDHALTMRWESAWLGSLVSEEAARMSAMDQATRNADDAIALLQRKYNRLRQEKITTELVEMISGSSL